MSGLSAIFSSCTTPINHSSIKPNCISASPYPAGVCIYIKERNISEPLICTESDVLTGHTELISSTNMERIVAECNAVLEQIRTMTHQLVDISALTGSIGGQTTQNWAIRDGGYPYYSESTVVKLYSFISV